MAATTKIADLHLLWLTGASCDGCTIKAIGETTAGGIEALLTGSVPGLPRMHLLHRTLSLEHGEPFLERLRQAERGEIDPYVLICESSYPNEALAQKGYFTGDGEEGGRPVPVTTWLERLAPRAAAVIAWGDCGVFGGPHSEAPNPTGATGVWMRLGLDYRSTLGLPVINLPGCAPEPILLQTLVQIVRWVQGKGELPALDALNRPVAFYPTLPPFGGG